MLQSKEICIHTPSLALQCQQQEALHLAGLTLLFGRWHLVQKILTSIGLIH